jgi:hypothetical protein
VTWKRVVYRAHAVRRLWQRGISRQQVRHVLATGVWRHQGPNWLVDGVLDRWPARVVVQEGAETITVITVMWVE